MTDADKKRLQIKIDIIHWASVLERLTVAGALQNGPRMMIAESEIGDMMADAAVHGIFPELTVDSAYSVLKVFNPSMAENEMAIVLGMMLNVERVIAERGDKW